MTISSNNYLQFHDYLFQLTQLPGDATFSRITQVKIAKQLDVDASGSGVSRFLSGETEKPNKMLVNFIAKYPIEFQKWPKGANTIERILLVSDAWYFLGIVAPQPTIQTPLNQAPAPLQIKIKKTPQQVPQTTVSVQQPPLLLTPKPHTPLQNRMVQTAPTTPNPQTVVVTSRINRQIRTKTPRSAMERAPVVISYRGHQTDKDGGGMLFDHMRFQTIMKNPTVTLLPENQAVANEALRLFNEAIDNHVAQLDFGVVNSRTKRRYPPTTTNFEDMGLLIVPGRVHKIENERHRLDHEYKIIRRALNRGQPILGICAGVWRIWEQLFIWTKYPSTLANSVESLTLWHRDNQTTVDVTDHTYRAMLRLDVNGRQATLNIDMHDINVVRDSILRQAMSEGGNRTTVNSVHWKAVNPDQAPLNVRITANSVTNDAIAKHNSHSRLMVPESCAEAFESDFGVPILGVQWHPEGYNSKDAPIHKNLLNYMRLAGDAYAAKRKMLKELVAVRN